MIKKTINYIDNYVFITKINNKIFLYHVIYENFKKNN